jgi:uncharacterized phage protein gp47/JayE
MSSFPLATLAAQIGPSGITGPSFADIQSSLIASFEAIYGSDVLLTPDTQDGQWIAVLASAFHDMNQLFIAIYNGYIPSFAIGAALSSLVKINGIQRQVATNSTAVLSIGGVSGTVIAAGVAIDSQQQMWNLPPMVTIPLAGTVDVLATAQNLGNLLAAPGTIAGIVNPQFGWQTVTNAASAIPGVAIESDASLRRRQTISTSLPAQTPLGAIAAAIANIPGVSRSIVYENSTGSPDVNGVPGHSIAVVTQGGNSTTIATAIETKKSPGTGTFGTTTIVVNDPAGLPISINFFVLTLTQVYVALTIRPLAGYVSSTGLAAAAAILAFINALAIGSPVYYNQILAVGGLIDTPVGNTFTIIGMTLGFAPSPIGTANLAIAYNSAAATAAANITQVLG